MINSQIERPVTIVIPTFNRGYIIKKTIASYIDAEFVGEVIIVSDGSTDDTRKIINELIFKNSNCVIQLIEHDKRMGAAVARHTGVNHATLKYIMFGEDDVYIEKSYVKKLLGKSINLKYDFASGRIIYLEKGENQKSAKARFGFGTNTEPLINTKNLRINQWKKLDADCETVFSHALYLAESSTLRALGFDEFYSNGAGYREETDTQVRGFLTGKRHLIVHDAFCFHMHFDDTPSGGQRISRLKQYYWNIKLNNYFLDKNYRKLQSKGLFKNQSLAIQKIFFLIDQTQVFIIRPNLLKIKSKLIDLIKMLTR